MLASLRDDVLRAVADGKTMRGRGRPRKETSRSYRLEVRLDGNDVNMIEHLSYLDDTSRSDTLRKALKTYFYIRTNNR